MTKAVPNSNLLSKLEMFERDCVTASIVWHELLYGVGRLAKGKKKSMLERYLADVVKPSFVQLPYDTKAALWHAAERVRLEHAGATPSFVDGQIAAIAATNDLTLITRNVQDFEEFKGLMVENWF